MNVFVRMILGMLLLIGAGVARADDASATVLDLWFSKHLVMIYRKETDSAPARLDPTIQATTLALEQEFLNKRYQLTEPAADVLRAMDQGANVIVTFAPDAGMSLIYSVYANLRPIPGSETAIAEVRIEARVFVGASLLAAEQGRGQMQTRTSDGLADYGARRGFELAAQRAAADLANRVDARLKTLSNDDIVKMIADDPPISPGVTVIAAPSPAPPPAAPTLASAPPSAAPVPMPTPSAPPPDAAPAPPAAAPPLANAPPPSVSPPPPPVAPPPLPVAPPTPVLGKHWLVTIGVQDYEHVIGIVGAGTHDNDLEGTATDVQNVQATLGPLGYGAANTIKLFDASATNAGVRQALDQLARSVGPNDTAVLYISGHGMARNFGKTGMTLPLFYDTNVKDENGVLDFAELVRRFAAVPAAKLVMLIDTCHSGGAASAFTTVSITARSVQVIRSGGAPDLARIMRSVALSHDIAIMSAAKTDETALDLGKGRGGLFTSNLLAGLRTTQGTTPLEDVYKTYVWAPVLQFCKSTPAGMEPCQQTPVLGYEGAGNLIRLANDNSQKSPPRQH